MASSTFSLSSTMLRKSIAKALSTARSPQARTSVVSTGRCFFASSTTACNPLATPIQLHAEWIPPKASSNNDDENYSILFMHGLLGNGRNLKTFARKVVEQTSSGNQSSCSGGILVDLRGHGRTFKIQKRDEERDEGSAIKYSSASTFQHCTQDIDVTLKEFQHPNEQAIPPTRVLVGHSFGGRLALEFAANASRSLPSQEALKAIWLLDTVPGQANDSVDRVLETITNVLEDIKKQDSKPPTKKQIVSILTDVHAMDLPTAQWLAMSYDEKLGDNFGFDNDLVTRLKPEFAEQDFMGLLRESLEAGNYHSTNTQIHVVRGGKNTGWSIPILSELERVKKEFPATFHLHVLPSAGHNVHIDDLPGLVNLFNKHA